MAGGGGGLGGRGGRGEAGGEGDTPICFIRYKEGVALNVFT